MTRSSSFSSTSPTIRDGGAARMRITSPPWMARSFTFMTASSAATDATRVRSSPSSFSGSSPKPRPATSPARSANRSSSASWPPMRRTNRLTVPSVQSA